MTIISRIIRQHPDVVYLSGNNKFFAGVDELDKTNFLDDTFLVRSPGYRNSNKKTQYDHPIFGFD